MTDKNGEGYRIRRMPGACCPDCNINGGYCYHMHKILVKEAIAEKEKTITHLTNEFEKLLSMLYEKFPDAFKYYESHLVYIGESKAGENEKSQG